MEQLNQKINQFKNKAQNAESFNVVNIPSILVIFGATGDLASKKIFPSLWSLFRQKRLPEHFAVIGFSRGKLSGDQFKKMVKAAIEKRGGEKNINSPDFSIFFKNFFYHSGLFENKKSFFELAIKISELESLWGICANKLFYLATPPLTYEKIFKNMAETKLNLPCGGKLGWSRILIEKPFGTNLKSAKKLQKIISKYFKEKQIYRIDHYLFKEIVQGIENFRFSNNLFENIWNKKIIDRIDIFLHETIGVEDRGGFYDTVGALRDVGQNHILLMLALLTMDYPENNDANAFRQNRAKILETLKPWNNDLLKNWTYRAQYSGYRQIKEVKPNSQTETYFALKTELSHQRWEGIPIYIEAGKKIGELRKEIVITLKHPRICHLCEAGNHGLNKIIFRLEPNNEIIIHFWTKKPGFEHINEERKFSFFLYEKSAKAQYVEEYAKVLFAAMAGHQKLFVSPKEIEAMWKFIDPVTAGWKRNIVPLKTYEPNTIPQPFFVKEQPDIKDGGVAFNIGEIGIIGLGKMGGNLAKRLKDKKWKVVGFDKNPDILKELEKEGMLTVSSLQALIENLSSPRIIWLMLPAGSLIDEIIFGRNGLIKYLNKGDVIIDGGNSFYKDSISRFKKLKKRGIDFVDVGVSGGPKGALYGASLMIGGNKKVFQKLESLFYDIAQDDGYQFFEGPGAGHFVKMIHNGIEYGIMQAIAEGFTILKKARYKLNLVKVADVYNHGSVIESRLIGWLKNALEIYGDNLTNVSGVVGHTGEGQWTVKTAKELKIQAKVITEALKFRINSQKAPSYTGKILSALREQFGGHKAKNFKNEKKK